MALTLTQIVYANDCHLVLFENKVSAGSPRPPMSCHLSGGLGRRAWLDTRVPLLRSQTIGGKNVVVTGL